MSVKTKSRKIRKSQEQTFSAIDGEFVEKNVLPNSNTVTRRVSYLRSEMKKLVKRADEQGLEMVSVDEIKRILEATK